MQAFYNRLMSLLSSWQILYVLTAALSVGIFYARSLVSITTGTLLAIGLLSLVDAERRHALSRRKEIIYVMGVFVVYALSVLLSQDQSKWLSQLNIGLPYLGIPLGLTAFVVDRRRLVHLLSIFIAATTVSACIITGDYLLHWQEYNDLYKFGQTIPTPILHVRYSYFVALACCLAVGLWYDHRPSAQWQRRTLGAVALFLFVFLHVLAVRTGLFACYAGLFMIMLVAAMRQGNWRLAAGMGVLILGVFAAGYWMLPSLRNKIDYMRHDLKVLVQQGALPQYSDNTRVISYQHGLTLFLRHPVLGAGIGDVTNDIAEIYERDTPQFPAERRYLPESDYLYWLATFGLVGTVVILGLLLYPLGLYWRRSYLLIGLYAVTLASSFGVTTLQLQLGKTAFLVLLCIILQYCRSQVIGQAIVTPVRPVGDDLVQ